MGERYRCWGPGRKASPDATLLQPASPLSEDGPGLPTDSGRLWKVAGPFRKDAGPHGNADAPLPKDSRPFWKVDWPFPIVREP